MYRERDRYVYTYIYIYIYIWGLGAREPRAEAVQGHASRVGSAAGSPVRLGPAGLTLGLVCGFARATIPRELRDGHSVRTRE